MPIIVNAVIAVTCGFVGGYVYNSLNTGSVVIHPPDTSLSDLTPEQTPEQLFGKCDKKYLSRCSSHSAEIFDFAICMEKGQASIEDEACKNEVRRINVILIPCLDEAKKFCAQVSLGGGRLHRCLVQNSKHASQKCLDALNFR